MSREALAWWVVAIIIVVAVAVVAALYSYACSEICQDFCTSQNLVAVSCMGGTVQASDKGAAIGLCNPVCAAPPPPPSLPAPPTPTPRAGSP